MRVASTLLLVLLLLLAALLPPVFAQPGGGPPGARDRGGDREAGEAHARDWSNLSEAARARGLARAEEARLFARFAYADGNATGRFVAFGLDPATGALRDFTLRASDANATFFTAVTPEGFAGEGTPTVAGARLLLEGANATLLAHNNPTALFQYRGENLTVRFQAPENATVTPENRSATITVGNVHGHVLLGGNGTLDVAGTAINATLTGHGSILFVAHPSGPAVNLATANLHALRDAVVSDRLGGMLSVVNAEGTPVTDPVYLGVTMRASRVEQGLVNVTVARDEPTGKAVVLFLDETAIDPDNGTVNVSLDGVPLPQAPGAEAVLQAAPGMPAAYHATAVPGGVQVVVNVPSFSERVITVSTETEEAPPTTPTEPTPTETTPPATTPTEATPPITIVDDEEDADAPLPAAAFAVAALAAVALLLRRRR